MNAELKAKWIAALRSGDYQQGCAFLRRPSVFDLGDAFCCLGVLCEVAGVPRFEGDSNSYVFGPEESGDIGSGFIEGPLANDIKQTTLARMNDEGQSFSEIADWIEANVPIDRVPA